MPAASSIRVGGARIDFVADDSEYQRVVTRVLGRQNAITRSNERVRRSARLSADANRQLVRSLTGFAASAGGAFVIVQAADAYTLYGNRVRESTSILEGYEVQAGRVANIQERLIQTAVDTRSALSGTVELYSRIAQSATILNTTTDEIIEFVRSVNQAAALGGATAVESRNALIQLSQGIASNTLRGEELRAVLEQLPTVADVIAKSLGVTRGGLRALSEQGLISGQVVLDAFKEAREEIEDRFGRSIPTVGQSLEVFRARFVELLGGEGPQGAIRLLSDGIRGLAENLDTATIVVGSAAAVFAGRFAGGLAQAARESRTLRLEQQATSRATLLATDRALQRSRLEAEAARQFGVRTASTTAGLQANTAAAFRYSAAQERLAMATRDNAVAQAVYQRTVLGAGRATRLASGALALLGGPVGAVVTGLTLAGAAWAAFGRDADAAADSAEAALTRVVEQLRTSASPLTTGGQALTDVETRIEELRTLQVELLRSSLSGATDQVRGQLLGAGAVNTRIVEITQEIARLIVLAQEARDALELDEAVESADDAVLALQRLSLSLDDPTRKARDLNRAIIDGLEQQARAAVLQRDLVSGTDLNADVVTAQFTAREKIQREILRVTRAVVDAEQNTARADALAGAQRALLERLAIHSKVRREAVRQVAAAEKQAVLQRERLAQLRIEAGALLGLRIDEAAIERAVREIRRVRVETAASPVEIEISLDTSTARSQATNFIADLEEMLAATRRADAVASRISAVPEGQRARLQAELDVVSRYEDEVSRAHSTLARTAREQVLAEEQLADATRTLVLVGEQATDAEIERATALREQVQVSTDARVAAELYVFALGAESAAVRAAAEEAVRLADARERSARSIRVVAALTRATTFRDITEDLDPEEARRGAEEFTRTLLDGVERARREAVDAARVAAAPERDQAALEAELEVLRRFDERLAETRRGAAVAAREQATAEERLAGAVEVLVAVGVDATDEQIRRVDALQEQARSATLARRGADDYSAALAQEAAATRAAALAAAALAAERERVVRGARVEDTLRRAAEAAGADAFDVEAARRGAEEFTRTLLDGVENARREAADAARVAASPERGRGALRAELDVIRRFDAELAMARRAAAAAADVQTAAETRLAMAVSVLAMAGADATDRDIERVEALRQQADSAGAARAETDAYAEALAGETEAARAAARAAAELADTRARSAVAARVAETLSRATTFDTARVFDADEALAQADEFTRALLDGVEQARREAVDAARVAAAPERDRPALEAELEIVRRFGTELTAARVGATRAAAEQATAEERLAAVVEDLAIAGATATDEQIRGVDTLRERAEAAREARRDADVYAAALAREADAANAAAAAAGVLAAATARAARAARVAAALAAATTATDTVEGFNFEEARSGAEAFTRSLLEGVATARREAVDAARVAASPERNRAALAAELGVIRRFEEELTGARRGAAVAATARSIAEERLAAAVEDLAIAGAGAADEQIQRVDTLRDQARAAVEAGRGADLYADALSEEAEAAEAAARAAGVLAGERERAARAARVAAALARATTSSDIVDFDSSASRNRAEAFGRSLGEAVARARRQEEDRVAGLAVEAGPEREALAAALRLQRMFEDELARARQASTNAVNTRTEAEERLTAAVEALALAGVDATDGEIARVDALRGEAETARTAAAAADSLASALERQAPAALAAAQAMGDVVASQMELSSALISTKDVTDLATSGIRSVEDALVDLATGGSATFKDFANAIISDMIRILARTVITRNALRALGVGPGGDLTSGGFLGSLFASFSGGGGGSAGAFGGFEDFAGAFQGGGVVGGPRGQGRFILAHAGEEVVTEGDPRHRRNRGAGGRGIPLELRVELVNQSSTPLRATTGDTRVDAHGLVQAVVLSDVRRNGPITQGMALAMRR